MPLMHEPTVNFPMVVEYRSWKFRLQMILALIEMTENLENTKYGTAYLCDPSRGNFGFALQDNRLIAKTIDND